MADKYDISSVQLSIHPDSDYQKVQNNFQGTETDSVGTIKTASKTFSNTSNSIIDESTRSLYTEETTLTRLHVVEDAISQVQSKLSSIDSKFDAIFQALVAANSQVSRPDQLGHITPLPTSDSLHSNLGSVSTSSASKLPEQSPPPQLITPSTLSTFLGVQPSNSNISENSELLTPLTNGLPNHMDLDSSTSVGSTNLKQHLPTGAGPLSGNEE